MLNAYFYCLLLVHCPYSTKPSTLHNLSSKLEKKINLEFRALRMDDKRAAKIIARAWLSHRDKQIYQVNF